MRVQTRDAFEAEVNELRQHSDDVVRRAVAEAEHNALQRVHCVTRLDHRRQVLAEFGTYHCALCCGPTCGRVGHCDFTQLYTGNRQGEEVKALAESLLQENEAVRSLELLAQAVMYGCLTFGESYTAHQ